MIATDGHRSGGGWSGAFGGATRLTRAGRDPDHGDGGAPDAADRPRIRAGSLAVLTDGQNDDEPAGSTPLGPEACASGTLPEDDSQDLLRWSLEPDSATRIWRRDLVTDSLPFEAVTIGEDDEVRLTLQGPEG
jgi:hypothetical protein